MSSWDPVVKKSSSNENITIYEYGDNKHQEQQMMKNQQQSNNNNNNEKDTHVVYITSPLPGQGEPDLGLPDMVHDMLWDKNKFMVRVFDLMTIALGITAAVSYFLSESSFLPWMNAHPNFVIALLIVKLLLVHGLAATAPRLSPAVATTAFFAYAVMNGIVLSPIFQIYTSGSIVSAFTSATIVFLTMSCYGYSTKKDLTSMGSLLIMSLWGIIVALIINAFLRHPMVDLLLSIVIIIVFTGLVAYDAQKIKKIGEALGGAGNHSSFTGLAIIGALELYLDFLNLFIHILKIFGNRK